MTTHAPESPRPQAEASLVELARYARRCQYLVHRLEDDELTEWDQAHRSSTSCWTWSSGREHERLTPYQGRA